NCVKTDATFRRMEADLHNLVPAVGELNGDRSNYRFGMLEGEPRVYGQCDFEVDFKLRRAEPKDDRRGDVARIYFYMRDQYGLQISRQQNQLFTAWSKLDPPDAWEGSRDGRLALLQGRGSPHVLACTARCVVCDCMAGAGRAMMRAASIRGDAASPRQYPPPPSNSPNTATAPPAAAKFRRKSSSAFW